MGLAFHSGLPDSEPMTMTHSRAKRVFELLGFKCADEGVLDAGEIQAAFRARIEPYLDNPDLVALSGIFMMRGPDYQDFDFAEGLNSLAKESPTGQVSYC